MALRDRIEIYIPVEAEVKSIPLWSLPNSIVRRMGLSRSDSVGSKNPTDSPKGIWICPAVIRRKGHKVAPHTGNDVKEDMISLMAESRAESGSYRMSFVSSNHMAYEVLKDTMPNNTVSAHTSQASLVPQGVSVQTSQDAVVIYNGQIYLSMRNHKRKQSKQKTCKSNLASQSSAPSSSDLSFNSQMKVPSDNEAKHKQITCKATQSQNTKCVTQKLRDAASSVPTHSVPSTDGVHKEKGHSAGPEPTAEEAAVQEPDWFEPWEEGGVAENDSGECEMQELGSEEAESLDHIGDTDSVNTNLSTGEFDQGRTQSWTRREPLGASTSLHECEFKELAQEEQIARMKARLKEKEAALNNLTS